ncbi:hypothetical protein E2562_027176 [Oryza meyeriana var. granulata]|uniref:Uncharacterized protein n=1 Tax=Oryza meyeriana var. granulata TaxID=110450 RepID=A0A6G1EQ51_9ORYZ|nr:hypothetical protein E2562_027176 [Oryza meyeriana var. granulata]
MVTVSSDGDQEEGIRSGGTIATTQVSYSSLLASIVSASSTSSHGLVHLLIARGLVVAPMVN